MREQYKQYLKTLDAAGVRDQLLEIDRREGTAGSDLCSAGAAAITNLIEEIEADRSEIAEALGAIRKSMASRYWLVESRGSYAYNDDQYQREFGQALLEIEAAVDKLRPLAADWSNCPKNRIRIEAARRKRAQKRNNGTSQ